MSYGSLMPRGRFSDEISKTNDDSNDIATKEIYMTPAEKYKIA